jgi:hypothetical protein
VPCGSNPRVLLLAAMHQCRLRWQLHCGLTPVWLRAALQAVNQNWAGHPGRLAASYVPSGWTHDHGALTAGHDRPGWPKNATLAAAEKACEGDSGCGGLTYHSSDPTPAGLVQIYLKDVGATPNADANWTHYSRADPVQV